MINNYQLKNSLKNIHNNEYVYTIEYVMNVVRDNNNPPHNASIIATDGFQCLNNA